MKRMFAFSVFAAFLYAVVRMMAPGLVDSVEGGAITGAGNLWTVKGGEMSVSLPVSTGGAQGMFVCWEEPAWRKPRAITFGLEGDPSRPVLLRSQVSHSHACLEIHTGYAGYMAKRKQRMQPDFDPLPDPVVLRVEAADGKDVSLLADGDGRPRVWLMRQSRFGDDFAGNFGLLIERASQYKPVAPGFGYFLFIIWFPAMLWTGWRAAARFFTSER